MTPDQVTEAMRLANLMATARVRRYAFKVLRTPTETEESINRKVEKTTEALRKYLEELKPCFPQHPVNEMDTAALYAEYVALEKLYTTRRFLEG